MVVGFLVLSVIGMFVFLDSTPAVDWDEGWTFDLARNWVERDFYGRELNGAPAPPGLAASFPVVATVALSYRLLGVGIWQGRVPAAVLMLSALAVFFWLVMRLWDLRIGLAALVLVILLAPHPRANAWWMARQLFAEPLMIMAILSGFACLLLARLHTRLYYGLAALSWGTALFAKIQPMPFVAITLMILVLLNLLNRRRSMALWILGVALGAIGVWRLWGVVHQWMITGHTMPVRAMSESYLVFGWVFTREIRLTALIFALLVGTPTILGLLHFVYSRLRGRQFLVLQDNADDLRIGLWVFASAWLAWFIGAAHAGIPRYIFPAVLIGAPFAALMFSDLTAGFDLRTTFARMMTPLRELKFTRQSAGAWLAFLLILFYLPLTLSIGWATWDAAEGLEVTATAEYLNKKTAPTSRIETYESPLFLYLERDYHFPPDALHLELNKRAAHLAAVVQYDALQADPDYLVVGPTGRNWKLYDDVIADGDFRLVKAFGQYMIYERVR
ncbi:MAG: hypothetical protein IT331_10230 [Anaerolineae bacterium]|nr:hypothetical protein [Anaerolineae bacterium]